MNRILITGDKGFVGSHIRAALESDKSRLGQEHVEDSRCFTGEMVGLEVRERFRDWYDDLYEVMDTPIDAVKNCLKYRHKSIYSVMPEYVWSNEDLALLVQWRGYQWSGLRMQKMQD